MKMQFGPTEAPGNFQYFIHGILLGRSGKDMASYLDNIMTYTKKGVHYKQSVTEVLEVLSQH